MGDRKAPRPVDRSQVKPSPPPRPGIRNPELSGLAAHHALLGTNRDSDAYDWHKQADALLKLATCLQAELEAYEASFDLYDKASRALRDAYKRAHPDVPDNLWPDATKVNVWAAERIKALTERPPV